MMLLRAWHTTSRCTSAEHLRPDTWTPSSCRQPSNKHSRCAFHKCGAVGVASRDNYLQHSCNALYYSCWSHLEHTSMLNHAVPSRCLHLLLAGHAFVCDSPRVSHVLQSIRRSRYRVVWDWGRRLYRWGAISYSALQLYEHPWVVRALLCAIWTSSKMAMGLLV